MSLSVTRGWIDAARPGPGEPPADRLLRAVAHLEEDAAARERLSRAATALLESTRASDTLASAGVLSDTPLHRELGRSLFERVLPPARDRVELRALIGALFHGPDDAAWLAAVPPRCWSRLVELLGLTVDPSTPIPQEIALAIRVLAHRIADLGLRPALTSRVPELGLSSSPFLDLSERALVYIRSHGNGQIGDEAALLDACLEILGRCRQAVDHLRANKHRYGTSLELTALSFRMLGLIDRLELLLELTDPRGPTRGEGLQRLLAELVGAERRRGELVPLLRQHGDLLLFQVVEQAAKKGRRYITTTRAEYGRFLVSSLGGGLIVALFALIKVKLAGLDLPLAGQALAYSLNYALCFVLIYLTGATLATKQPAVTAHTLAASLGDAGDHHLGRLVERVTQAWRSQFISFVGNLAMAFPVGWLLTRWWQASSGAPLLTAEKASRLLADVHPWQGPALWYAAIAGVFLFAAGVVSGWVDNRMTYSQIPARIAASAGLTRRVGEAGAARLARAVDAKAGALTGNIFLGFCLGSAGTVGHILGLPLDIRHIAFGAAQLGMGLEGLAWSISLPHMAALAAGIALIGFVNFLVSFGLALLMAAESRQLSLSEARDLLHRLRDRARRRPLEFFFPPGKMAG